MLFLSAYSAIALLCKEKFQNFLAASSNSSHPFLVCWKLLELAVHLLPLGHSGANYNTQGIETWHHSKTL